MSDSQRAPAAESLPWAPSANPWAIATAVMTATFMVVLDSSVANVALPHIAGNLSASTDEATWVLTSYCLLYTSEWGNKPSSRPARKTSGNSRPLAA